VHPRSGLDDLQVKKHPLTPTGIMFQVNNLVTVQTVLHTSPNYS